MIVEFKTLSGSAYIIDSDKKTWNRPHNPNSTNVRDEGGEYYELSPITVGEPVTITCPPITAGASLRLVVTTPVIELMAKF